MADALDRAGSTKGICILLNLAFIRLFITNAPGRLSVMDLRSSRQYNFAVMARNEKYVYLLGIASPALSDWKL